MKYCKNMIILLLLMVMFVISVCVHIAYAQNTVESANEEYMSVVFSDGYDPHNLEPTLFPNLEQTGQNILKIWGGYYLTTDSQICYSFANNYSKEMPFSLGYYVEAEINGTWYQLFSRPQLTGPALYLLPGGSTYGLVSKDIQPGFYPGKHRIIIGEKNSSFLYYSEFEVVDNGSKLAEKPADYDRQFLILTPKRYFQDKLTEEYQQIILEEDGLDIIEIINQPISTVDKYITFCIDIENKNHAHWRDLYFETMIDGQWCLLAIYEPSYLYFSNGSLEQYLALFPDIDMDIIPVAELTLEKVSLHNIWDPAGPFAGRHRLWGRLILEDGSTVIPYTEFDIIEAANATYAGTSAWAQETVRSAISASLVPQNLQRDYQQPIARAEFAALTLAYLESATGFSAADLLREKNLSVDDSVFSDTGDTNVLAAQALGIVEGLGEGIFDPNGNITREQLATMLARTQAVLAGGVTPAPASAYADKSLFSPWAIPSIDYVTAQGIMSGVGDRRFDPKGNCTREQAIVTFFRMMNIDN